MFAGGEVDRLKGLKWYPDGEFLSYNKPQGQKSDPDEKGIVTVVRSVATILTDMSEK